MSAPIALEALKSGPKTAAQLCATTGVKTRHISRTMADLMIAGKAVRIDGGAGRGSIAVYALPGAGSVPTIRVAWNDERVATLRRLWTEGQNASQIAKQLRGVSRNAVIGKLDREGLLGPDSSIRRPAAKLRVRKPRPERPARPAKAAKSKPAAPPKARMRVVIGGNGAVTIHEQRHPFAPPPKAQAFVALPGTTPQPFGAHKAHFCKWPIHDPADTDDIARLSCGEPCEGRYCKPHETLSAAPNQPRPMRDLYDPAITRIRGAGSARISA